MQILNKNFLEKLNLIYSKEELDIIKKGFSKKRRTVFRLNLLKTDFNVLEELNNLGFEIEQISFLKNSYFINKLGKIRLSETKSFKEGYIYLQGITSQISIEILKYFFTKKDFSKKYNILDLTAAPGGKTTQIASIFKKSEIIANELNKIRFEKLKYTVKKQGAENVRLINHNANDLKNIFKKEFFDIIIADLPCSAEGRINLNNSKTYKYLDKYGINKKNYRIQQEILKNTIPLLKKGGELIYSTCTLDPLENEGILHYVLCNFKDMNIEDISDYFKQDFLKKISKPGILNYKKYIFKREVSRGIRLFPSEFTEGFFVSKLVKESLKDY